MTSPFECVVIGQYRNDIFKPDIRTFSYFHEVFAVLQENPESLVGIAIHSYIVVAEAMLPWTRNAGAAGVIPGLRA
jgi:hypothetical protein